jgi:aromatic ring-cleaving dioxygenase
MQEVGIGTIIRHTQPHDENFYIVASSGDSRFTLLNLVQGTRASRPSVYNYPISMDDVRDHMGTLLEEGSVLEVLRDCVLSFALAPVEPLKGTIAIGRGE